MIMMMPVRMVKTSRILAAEVMVVRVTSVYSVPWAQAVFQRKHVGAGYYPPIWSRKGCHLHLSPHNSWAWAGPRPGGGWVKGARTGVCADGAHRPPQQKERKCDGQS